MMLRFYTILLRMGLILVPIFSRKSEKVKKWVKARNQWVRDLEFFEKNKSLIWFHCASVGEFEQARPVIEALAQTGDHQIAVTFFSSSGYEAKADYPLADVITYLPSDLPENVTPFLEMMRPDVAIFVKYEFWFNFMDALHARSIPMALISAYFPDKHWTIQWPGILLGERLKQLDVIFTQDEMSRNILASVMIDNAENIGDTRVDRVLAVKDETWSSDLLSAFFEGNQELLLVGSNWSADDRIIIPALKEHSDLKVIVVPHEIREYQKEVWISAFGDELIFIGDLESGQYNHQRILYVDRMGLLSKLYRYATVAYVGGGFGKAVHNTLEAAVYNIPIVFGPKNQRFQEVQSLKKLKIGIEVKSLPEFSKALDHALNNEAYRNHVQLVSNEFFQDQKGATQKIVTWIQRQFPEHK